MKRILWIIMVILAILIGLYPIIYLVVEGRFGLFRSKSDELLSNTFWQIGFYLHTFTGGLALLIGWSQFSNKLRSKYLNLHKLIGKFYVLSVLSSSVNGFYISFFATGGFVAALGFLSLQ